MKEKWKEMKLLMYYKIQHKVGLAVRNKMLFIMIQEFILGEKEHFDWVRQDVKLIELVGLENYMLE